ncbi:glutaminase [Arthrobacter sp. 3Tela_A]|uniref:glutaminase n=1 Tax=Arthrobacter sp. 3Tela_A TaxID=3093743 RepID=UPI003BB6669E
MRSVVHDYLAEALSELAAENSGELAGYIPELAGADPERLGAVFTTVDGEVYGAGDDDVEFTIQSISKPFAYALALADRGFSAVLAKVGVEPSGEAFNEISLENETGRPRNPMINAGAITTHSLLGSEHLLPAERVDRVVRGLSAFAGRRLEVDETVCVSEMENAHRNLASAHMLRSHNILTGDPRDVVEGYIRQCSVLVTARDLAVMAATLANQGVNPVTGERGVSLFERFSSDMGLHVMEVPAAARAVVRSNHVLGRGAGAVRVLQAQGGIRFAGAERIVREFIGANFDESRVVLDFTLVSSLDDVARRMLLELARRLAGDGLGIYFVDPELIIPDPDRGDGVLVPVIADAEHLLRDPARKAEGSRKGVSAADP